MSNRRRVLTAAGLAFASAMLMMAGLGAWVARVEAASPIYVRPAGDNTNCNGTVDVDYNGSNGPACAVKTIQMGVDLVDAGGTVEVAAGYYTETVLIEKSLSLLGAQRNVIPSDPNPRAGGESYLRPPAGIDPRRSNLITIHVDNVTVNGFLLDGNNPTRPDCTKQSNGVCLHVAAGVANGLDSDNWVDYSYTHPVNSTTISHNIIKNMNHHGVTLNSTLISSPATSGNLISENFFDNMSGAVHDGAENCDNDPQTNEPCFYSYGPRRGVWVVNNHYTTLANNRITRVYFGIQFASFYVPNPGADVSISENQISAVQIAVREQNFSPNSEVLPITRNTFTGGSQGIDLNSIAASLVVQIANNFFNGQTTGVILRNNSAARIMDNNLSGTTTGVNVMTGALNDASGNWWGDPKVSFSANVDFTPWLDSGTDTSSDPGFQGDFSSLTVDDNSPQSGGMGYITEGLGAVNTGGVVHVTSGTYNESVLLNMNASVLATGNIVLNDNLDILQGSFTAPSGSMSLGGDFTLGGGTFTHNDGEVVLNGDGQQIIGGSQASTFNDLRINNFNGVILGQEANVDGDLLMDAGVLSLGSNDLILGTSATAGGSFNNSTMIAADSTGQLCKAFSGVGSFTYSIGDETGTPEYSPAELTFTSGTFAPGAQACLNLRDEKHPANDSYNHLTRYWTVVANGISGYQADISLIYNDPADIYGSEGYLIAKKYDSGSWTLGEPANTTLNQISMTGLSSFSDFTGGNSPTAISLAAFDATAQRDSIRVNWETTYEIDVLGFDLYRADTASGVPFKLTPQLIVATGGGAGASYEFIDTVVQPGNSYSYWLEPVNIDGPGSRTGPVTITLFQEIYLPLLLRY